MLRLSVFGAKGRSMGNSQKCATNMLSVFLGTEQNPGRTICAMKKTLVSWRYIGDELLPCYMGIIINQYKDP